jgi:hypothetical protein
MNGASCWLARLRGIVEQKMVVDAAIDCAGISELYFALKHIEKLKNITPDMKKLLIFDRGYPSARPPKLDTVVVAFHRQPTEVK